MSSKFIRKLKSAILMSFGGTVVFAGINIYKENEKFYNDFIIPTMHYCLSPENAHKLAVFVYKYQILPKTKYQDPLILKTKFLNMNLTNPIGIAAGFDKQAESVEGLTNSGFGFVEIGSVTPQPQPGNALPRVFRLPEDQAVINRYGFNSDGHNIVLERLLDLRHKKNYRGVIGVNLGKNKESSDPINDYVEGVKKFGIVADYLVINISSPNTPGLRLMQHKDELKKLLKHILRSRESLGIDIPILLKLAPDLDSNERKEIAKLILIPEYRIDGLIISNTTVSAKDTLLNEEYKNEVGGLSGKPLKLVSTQMISEMYKLTNGEIPIIGAGGIFNGEDAFEKIKAGATLVQLYTSFVFHGPPIVNKIKTELADLVQANGYENIQQAVGVDTKLNQKKFFGLF